MAPLTWISRGGTLAICIEKFKGLTSVDKISSLKSGISIVICTFNGALKLPGTIEALAYQIVPFDIDWEILVVDNNSSDDSGSVAQQLWEAFEQRPKISFQVLHEEHIGKHYALNLGLRYASFKYFIIVDDDNRLSQHYVARAFQLINGNPKIGAIGSRSTAVFQEDKIPTPQWFKESAERFAIGEQGNTGNVTNRKHLWGAGLVSKTDLYTSMYKQYPSLLTEYPKTKILIAEDTEYCLRLILRGYQLHYSSDLLLHHFVPNERLTKEYWKKLNGNIEESFKIIDAYYMAVKIFTKKYQTPWGWWRLKLLTLLRYCLEKGQKKRRQRILLGFLFPNSRYNTPLIKNVISFVHDQKLPREV